MALRVAIDIGNSALKTAYFRDAVILETCRIRMGTDDEIQSQLGTFIARDDIESVGVSSVVPNATRLVRQTAPRHCSFVEINARLRMPITIDYATPDTLGADRLASAVGAWSEWGAYGAVIVVDIGTAVNIEAITAEGHYLGGIITAGPDTVRRALQGRTAQLPEAMLKIPPRAIGTSTQDALRAGIMYGVIDQTEGAVRRLKIELAQRCVVVATGGWCEALGPSLKTVDHFDSHLALRGIRILMEMNAP